MPTTTPEVAIRCATNGYLFSRNRLDLDANRSDQVVEPPA